jgi:hypothetical protein
LNRLLFWKISFFLKNDISKPQGQLTITCESRTLDFFLKQNKGSGFDSDGQWWQEKQDEGILPVKRTQKEEEKSPADQKRLLTISGHFKMVQGQTGGGRFFMPGSENRLEDLSANFHKIGGFFG